MPDSPNIIYMLHDEDGHLTAGPLLGAPDLDLKELADAFRAQQYARCEAEQKDYCPVGETEFVQSLIERKLLTPIATHRVTVRINTYGEHRYIPRHWPTCPACSDGRGEQEMGNVRHDLNRAEWFLKCTECGHAWDHHDERYLESRGPMLDDDGRYVDGGCVPYAISQVAGLPMESVLTACKDRGWKAGEGMETVAGIAAAQECGVRLIAQQHRGLVAGRLTLGRLLDRLPATQNYIIATSNHWLAVVQGENRDQSSTHRRVEVVSYWEAQPA